MADEPDYIVDVSHLSPTPAGGKRREPRGWLGVRFRCCDVYSRIWRNREGTAYVGHCPRCSRRVQALIGQNGTDARFFEAV